MNHALPTVTMSRPAVSEWSAEHDGEAARLRRLRALLSLFCLYAVALVGVILVSDGADIGCILAGIAGHVLYATYRMVVAWRDASWLETARAGMMRRCFAR